MVMTKRILVVSAGPTYTPVAIKRAIRLVRMPVAEVSGGPCLTRVVFVAEQRRQKSRRLLTNASPAQQDGDIEMTIESLSNQDEADRNLLQHVKVLLCQRCHWFHQVLKVSVKRGIAVVQGQLPTFYLRQVAVECVNRASGVTQVVDLIQVVGDHCQPREESEDQREASVVVMLQGVGFPDLDQTSQNPHRPDSFRNRLTSVKG
jgi:hypothetical protein